MVLDESISSNVKPYMAAHFNGGQTVAKALDAALKIPLISDCDKVTINDLVNPKSHYFLDFIDLMAIVVSVNAQIYIFVSSLC